MRDLEWIETLGKRTCGVCRCTIPKKTKFLREQVYDPYKMNFFKQRVFCYCPKCALDYIRKISQEAKDLAREIGIYMNKENRNES